MSIPIQNLFYMYCYAWRRFEALKQFSFLSEDAPDSFVNLWALVLTHGFARQVRRGLDHGYVGESGRLGLPKGQMHFLKSMTSGASAIGQMECSWEEFVPDTKLNRIIKGTMRKLARCSDVDPKYTHQLKRNVLGLSHVRDITPTVHDVDEIQLNRHNSSYRLLLDTCRLVLEFLTPLDGSGSTRFRDPRRDDRHMARVFEQFLLAWFQRHAPKDIFHQVRAAQLNWPATSLGEDDELKYLPKMQTDICLIGKNGTMIIDAKYYHQTLLARREEAIGKIISGHLYQLHAYQSAWQAKYPESRRPDGMLLYPTIGQHVSLGYQLYGSNVRVQTICLSQSWKRIEDSLAKLVNSLE